MNHPVALDYPPRFSQRGLHDKLIHRRPQQLSGPLEGVLHVLRHPGRDPAAFVVRECHLGLGAASRFGSRQLVGLIELELSAFALGFELRSGVVGLGRGFAARCLD